MLRATSRCGVPDAGQDVASTGATGATGASSRCPDMLAIQEVPLVYDLSMLGCYSAQVQYTGARKGGQGEYTEGFLPRSPEAACIGWV